MSIKTKITLWYAGMMLLIIALVLAFVLSVSVIVVDSNTKKGLTLIVDYNADEIEYGDTGNDNDGDDDIILNEFLKIDDDFTPLQNGVYSVVLSESGELIYGQYPEGFNASPQLSDRETVKITSDGGKFFVYDRKVTYEDYTLYIRGMAHESENIAVLETLTVITMIGLPVFVLIGVIVGHSIAKRAFRPIEGITTSANEISSGSDLSRRITTKKNASREPKELSDAFNKMFERLERSFNAEKQFTSDASHELRTPVAVIKAQCAQILEEKRSEGEYREAIEVIARQSDKMTHIIAELLAFTRLEQGTELLEKEQINLSELVRDVCDEQRTLARRGIVLSSEIEADIEAEVDVFKLMRLLQNLICNAFDYGKEGGSILVTLRKENSVAVLCVTDNGVGIDEKDIDKLFNRFFRADRSGRNEGGLGLGLSMVKQIACLHGGSVSVASEKNTGTTFTVTIPCK